MILDNFFPEEIIFYKIVISKNTKNNKVNVDQNINEDIFEITLNLKPIVTKRNLHVSHLPPYKKVKDLVSTCAICIQDFKSNEYYRELPKCKHQFHKKCIDKWFKIDKQMSCPICRKEYIKN